MHELLLATTNKGKLEEFYALLKDFPVKLRQPEDLNIDLNVIENGATYADNAALKAEAYCRASGLITLADDSGLEVKALDGAPGLYSARFSPLPDATDATRRALLLKKLQSFPTPWLAEFHAVIAIAIPPQKPNFGIRMEFAEGICHGEIVRHEKGSNGFGYDPIFFIPSADLTMAELSMEEKNKISHRARAIMAAIPVLEEIFQSHP
jgi:XTP/dITP diphosphohydrolase